MVEIVQLPISRWNEYKELRLRALQTDPQAFTSSYQDESEFPDEKWQKRLEKVGEGQSWVYFVQNTEGNLVGMIGAYRNEENLKNHTAEIWGVYTVPEERRKGIAGQLMSMIIEVLSINPDIKTLSLQVNTDQEAAKNLYEKFGFTLIKTHPFMLGDGIEHKVSSMEKRLRDN